MVESSSSRIGTEDPVDTWAAFQLPTPGYEITWRGSTLASWVDWSVLWSERKNCVKAPNPLCANLFRLDCNPRPDFNKETTPFAC